MTSSCRQHTLDDIDDIDVITNSIPSRCIIEDINTISHAHSLTWLDAL